MIQRTGLQIFHQPTLFREMRPPKEVFRYLRNYLAGQFVGATRDDVLLDEVLKCLFCKLRLEISDVKPDESTLYDPIASAQFYRCLFSRVRAEFPEIYDVNEELLLSPEHLQRAMDAMEFSLLDAKSDPIADAYEVFAGSESRARSGQFFTPRNATDLLVRMIDPQPGEKIIDPACGAGGFLASVIRHFRLQKLSVEDVVDATSSLYGVEKDCYLTKLGRLHLSLLSGGHPNVLCGDSLSFTDEDGGDLGEFIPRAGYDVVLTNPPFGVKIVAASMKVLERFELAHRWKLKENRWQPTHEIRDAVPPQVLFVEKCLSLLREGGRLGIVIPESVLSNKSYRYVVEFLRSKGRVEAVIGMPESLFKTSGKGGTHTKTCLMVFVKDKEWKATGKVFMAEARWCGKDSRAREIPHDDLPKIGERFRAFGAGKLIDSTPLGFVITEKSIADNVLCPRYYDPELEAELKGLSTTHQLLRFGTLVEKGCLTASTGDEVGKLAYGMGEVPFIRTSDLSNWEIKIDPKHRVDKEVYDSLKGKQDVQGEHYTFLTRRFSYRSMVLCL